MSDADRSGSDASHSGDDVGDDLSLDSDDEGVPHVPQRGRVPALPPSNGRVLDMKPRIHRPDRRTPVWLGTYAYSGIVGSLATAIANDYPLPAPVMAAVRHLGTDDELVAAEIALWMSRTRPGDCALRDLEVRTIEGQCLYTAVPVSELILPQEVLCATHSGAGPEDIGLDGDSPFASREARLVQAMRMCGSGRLLGLPSVQQRICRQTPLPAGERVTAAVPADYVNSACANVSARGPGGEVRTVPQRMQCGFPPSLARGAPGGASGCFPPSGADDAAGAAAAAAAEPAAPPPPPPFVVPAPVSSVAAVAAPRPQSSAAAAGGAAAGAGAAAAAAAPPRRSRRPPAATAESQPPPDAVRGAAATGAAAGAAARRPPPRE
jgi:hypothetical protein